MSRLLSSSSEDRPQRLGATLVAGLLLLGLSLGGRAVEAWLAFDTNAIIGHPPQVTTIPLAYGSYGLYLARVPPKIPGRRRVVLLGNSVYQAHHVADLMQRLANRESARLTFVNLSQTGAGIHDHVVELAKAVSLQPDLVVLSVLNLSFSSDFGGKDTVPEFRTDDRAMVFDADVLPYLPLSFVGRELSGSDLLDSYVASIFPLTRSADIARQQLDHRLLAGSELHARVRDQFPLLELNLVADWLERNPGAPPAFANRLYTDTPELVAELVSIAIEAKVPLLIIRQEAGPSYATPDVAPILSAVADRLDGVAFVDLMGYFRPGAYPDEVHPMGDEVWAYARRHYGAIRGFLEARGVGTGVP